MFYNRQEHYRYAFGHPQELLIRSNEPSGTSLHYGLLLDVSPRGGKFFLEKELEKIKEEIDVEFTLNHEKLYLKGILLWKESTTEGWMYGMEFHKDPGKEMLINNELKAYLELE
ncbi:PilZ domain-containing protein [Planococcus ruber]|uniref:PilZ domain-containing protein n=1 Tax=Planococcus ruber TaxID=2027871 RepID=UPI001FEE791C|nr:PilZ domain-containing protein [Planococcus ruber]MCJ1906985.1 PilZ domain-containing protein [Planococcus ruber]